MNLVIEKAQSILENEHPKSPYVDDTVVWLAEQVVALKVITKDNQKKIDMLNDRVIVLERRLGVIE